MDELEKILKLTDEIKEIHKQNISQKNDFCDRMEKKYAKQFAETPELQRLMEQLRNLT